ncbi:hypothetical protein [Nocardioides jensenii]|uniref:hypothetical protein n=1 Tax=Nocardioides jensenii TaxID=1843 RepID=UPI000ADCC413|nr:hypothetical protein [Nocardioides jensenii]
MRSRAARVEVVVLTAANLAVTVMRFLAMRLWMFRTVPDPKPAMAAEDAALR